MERDKNPVNDLAKACARTAEAAEWQELMRRCTPIVGLAAARVARVWLGTVTAPIIDDIVQEVFLKLCDQERRILREFKPQGEDSFLGLLRVITASVANDYFRKRYSEKRGGKSVTVSLADEPSGAFSPVKSQSVGVQRQVLFSELDRMLQSAPDTISDRDRTIFWLYYLQGLTADEIAGLPATGLSAKGVESALRRVVTWLRTQMSPPRSKPAPAPASDPN